MKILQINKFLYRKGGSEEYMFQLTELLRDNGVKCAFWGMADEKNVIADEHRCFADNIDYQSLKGIGKLSGAMNTIYSKANAKKIGIILDAFKPDIAHLHNYNFQLTPAILPEIRRRGVKIVHTAHDSQLTCPYHRLYNYQQQAICEKCVVGKFHRCVSNKCFDGSVLKSFIGAAESYLYHGMDYYNKYINMIISPGEFLAGYIRQSVNVPVAVIPNFTRDTLISRQAPSDDYVLYFGRISDEKGILEVQNSPVWRNGRRLKIVGDGPDKDRLRSSKNIDFIGHKYGQELHKIIAGARYVILPSKCYENCPMTVIESFMAGTPVIASNSGGFKDMIEHGKNGFLFDFSNDREGLLEEILAMDPDPLREHCRETYRKRYASKVHFDQIMDVYRKVLA